MMAESTPVSIAIKQVDGRLFVDRNDLIVAVNEIARRGGPITKVVDLLTYLNPDAARPVDLYVEES
jgi:hypothetical protein